MQNATFWKTTKAAVLRGSGFFNLQFAIYNLQSKE
jgi:hypothetical protein